MTWGHCNSIPPAFSRRRGMHNGNSVKLKAGEVMESRGESAGAGCV